MSNKKEGEKGTMSVEHFHHFNCVECTRWWGIGDPPNEPLELFCPWCGTKQSFVDKTPKVSGK